MKKQWIWYAGIILVVGGLFSAGYYMSYQRCFKRFQEEAVKKELFLSQETLPPETNEQELADFTEVGAEPSVQANENDSIHDTNTIETIEADTQDTQIIKKDTICWLETYQRHNDTTIREEVPLHPDLIGLDRAQTSQYLVQQLDVMPLYEHEKGWYAYELLVFSEREIVLRKSYDSALCQYKYYITEKNGFLIVYYSDKKTVYEYTSIEVSNLTEKEKNLLQYGIYAEDVETLFTILESFTS